MSLPAKINVDASIDISSENIQTLLDGARPVLEPFGIGASIVSDKLALYRFKCLVEIVKKASEIAEKAGIDPQVISKKFLARFVDEASFEDDAKLQEMWSNLLVSQAGCEEDHSCYINILKQLSLKTAILLHEIYAHATKNGYNPHDSFLEPVQAVTADGETRYHSYKTDSDDSYLILQVLDVNTIRADTSTLNRFLDVSVLEQLGLIDLVKYADFTGGATLHAKLTLSGYQFVNICTDKEQNS